LLGFVHATTRGSFDTRCTSVGDNLKYRYLSRRSRYPLRRSAEELSFAFSLLLTQPLSRP
jgi:hypothetical protein